MQLLSDRAALLQEVARDQLPSVLLNDALPLLKAGYIEYFMPDQIMPGKVVLISLSPRGVAALHDYQNLEAARARS